MAPSAWGGLKSSSIAASNRARRRRGAPGAPAGRPRGLAGLGSLPEREVAWIALALVDVDAGPGEQLVEVLAGEPAVGREAPDLEVDVAVHHVGESAGDEALDERDHLGDVLGRLWVA